MKAYGPDHANVKKFLGRAEFFQLINHTERKLINFIESKKENKLYRS